MQGRNWGKWSKRFHCSCMKGSASICNVSIGSTPLKWVSCDLLQDFRQSDVIPRVLCRAARPQKPPPRFHHIAPKSHRCAAWRRWRGWGRSSACSAPACWRTPQSVAAAPPCRPPSAGSSPSGAACPATGWRCPRAPDSARKQPELRVTGGRGREREAKCDELPAATQQEAEESEQEREPPPSPLRRGEDEGQKKGKNNSRKENFFCCFEIE